MSWFTVGLIRCVTIHTSALTMGNSSRLPRQGILQIGGSALQHLLDCQNPWIDCELLIILQGTHDLYFMCNSKCTQVMYNISDMDLNA